MDAAALADEWTIVPTIAFLRKKNSILFWATIVPQRRDPPTRTTHAARPLPLLILVYRTAEGARRVT